MNCMETAAHLKDTYFPYPRVYSEVSLYVNKVQSSLFVLEKKCTHNPHNSPTNDSPSYSHSTSRTMVSLQYFRIDLVCAVSIASAVLVLYNRFVRIDIRFVVSYDAYRY